MVPLARPENIFLLNAFSGGGVSTLICRALSFRGTAESLQLLQHRHSEPFGSLKAGSTERSEESILKNQKDRFFATLRMTKNMANYGQNQIALENFQL
jgi:hypothetical protein